MPLTQSILFDLDGTLLNREQSLVGFLSHQWSSRLGLQTISQEKFIQQFLEFDDNGKVWKDVVYEKIITLFNIQNVNPAHLLQDYISGFKNHTLLFPGVPNALKILKDRGLKLGIITNGRKEFQSNVIRSCGLEPFMDVILISEAEGLKKPDPLIFNKALNKLGTSAAQSIFIGDNPEADIYGAHSVGMKTVWFQNTNFKQPEKTILSAVLKDYKDLPSLTHKLMN